MTHSDAPIPIACGRRVERSGPRRAPIPFPTGLPTLLAALIHPAALPLPTAFRPSAPPPRTAPFRRPAAAALRPTAPPRPRR